MKERENFQKLWPFDIRRVFHMLMMYKYKWQDCNHLAKDIIIIQLDKMRSKLDQLNFDSAVTI